MALLGVVAACGDDDAPSGSADAGRDSNVAVPDSGVRDLGPNPTDGATPPPPPPVDAASDGAARPDGSADPDASTSPDAGRDPDAAVAPDGGDGCAAQDVSGEGACGLLLGVFWLGDRCGYVSGCSCVGADCGAGFASEAECARAYARCSMTRVCATDADCTAGAEWCTAGRCVECDNSGRLCDIACAEGFSTYTRNGCEPCRCAPVTMCTSDGDCAGGARCYAGRECWDWCPPGEPSCCLGSFCDRAGCPEDPPEACTVAGCPTGQECRETDRCLSSECLCGVEGAWVCTRDCVRMECFP